MIATIVDKIILLGEFVFGIVFNYYQLIITTFIIKYVEYNKRNNGGGYDNSRL